MATPLPSRDGGVDGIVERDRESCHRPIRPTISPASAPDMIPICKEESQDQVLDRVSVVTEGSVEFATDAVDASPRRVTQTGEAPLINLISRRL